MYTKEKIHQYAEFKKITLFEFEKKAGISSGTMRKGKDFEASLVIKIRNNFPDLNINWLLYDEGEMILKEKMMAMEFENDNGAQSEIEQLKELLKAKNETIAILKHQLGIDDGKSETL